MQSYQKLKYEIDVLIVSEIVVKEEIVVVVVAAGHCRGCSGRCDSERHGGRGCHSCG